MHLAGTEPASEPARAPGHRAGAPPGARHYPLAAFLLAVMFALAAASALHKTPVATEAQHMARGWAFWQTGRLLPAGTLPLPDLLAGLGGLLEPTLPAPPALAGWSQGDLQTLSDDLLWRSGIALDRAVFLFRLPSLWLGLLLGAVVWRWARQLYGPGAASLALALLAFSPNILAYTRLATPDIARATFFVAALFAWSRYLSRQAPGWLVASGLTFGLALSSSYAALLLMPTFTFLAVLSSGLGRDPRPGSSSPRLVRLPLGWLWRAVLELIVVALLGGLVAGGLLLATTRQPDVLAAYLDALRRFAGGAGSELRPTMLGRSAESGWLYDTFVILGLKLPLPTLLLFVVALAGTAARPLARREWDVAFTALVFLAASLLDPLGPELRYLLPLLVLMIVFSARVLAHDETSGWLRPALAGLVALSLALTSLFTFPDYLSYFNLPARFMGDAPELLVGSNSDWGQDLGQLAEYLDRRGVRSAHLSLYGDADPAAYGIDSLPLPPETPAPGAGPVAFHPLNPAPGLYAISATHLSGAPRDLEPGTFGYFNSREPTARIGGSIYVYDVPPLAGENGAPRWLARCEAAAPLASAEQLRELAGVPDLDVFDFDCESSLAVRGGMGWLLLPDGVEPVVDLGAPDFVGRTPGGEPSFRVWLSTALPAVPASSVEFPPVSLPLPIAGRLELLGYEASAGQVAPGGDLLLTTWWRVREPPAGPVSLFARLVSTAAEEVASADGLGVPVEDWRPGMIIVQQHRFELGAALAPGRYSLVTGLYSPESGRRYPVFQSEDRLVDRIVLRGITVGE